MRLGSGSGSGVRVRVRVRIRVRVGVRVRVGGLTLESSSELPIPEDNCGVTLSSVEFCGVTFSSVEFCEVTFSSVEFCGVTFSSGRCSAKGAARFASVVYTLSKSTQSTVMFGLELG